MRHSFGRRAILKTFAGFCIANSVRPRFAIGAQDTNAFPPFTVPIELPAATPRADGPLRVIASTTILADLATQIGGERVDAKSILPANADPHEFEAAPRDIVAIEDADLVILHGLQLDAWAEPLVQAAMTNAPVIIASDGIVTIGSDEEDFSEGDPHIWFDPIRVQQMAVNIEAGLVAVDPDGAADYGNRLNAYHMALDALDREIAERIQSIPEDKRVLVTNHDALAYYAERYRLTIVGTIIPGLDARTEPSAREISQLIAQIRDTGVQVIFTENTVNPAIADGLANDAGIRVAPELYTDSLGDPGSGADTYIGLMETDTRIIVENLRA